MKRLITILVCILWYGMVHATEPALTLAIRIDTAYVSNDMHIELEYRVLVPFSKINLSVFTSMDATNARQNTNAPLVLSGGLGTFRKRIPLNLPQDQIVEIVIQLKGDGFVNNSDSTNYASGTQKQLFVKRGNSSVVNY